MKYSIFSLLLLFGIIIYLSACKETEDVCMETTWYQDADEDGLGNPDITIDACTQPEGYVDNADDTDDAVLPSSLHPAFADFDSNNFTIFLDGNEVVIESNGLPNHSSPYWSNTTERCTVDPMGQTLCTNANTTENHPLFVAPTATSFASMAPGNIDDFNGSYTLRVPVNPELASNSSATGLGPIGIAVSGAMIYNDEEGPNIPLDDAVPSLDYTAAHTGPQSYHYHLEPKAWSDDDEKLIGIMSDGFFLYGRKDDVEGNYPTDLDASGGHFGPTIHNPDGEYHYHIQNETYLNQYYLLFPDDFQGTPNTIQ
ncbi:MAG: YHYH protein [Bacteroidota bacterium]